MDQKKKQSRRRVTPKMGFDPIPDDQKERLNEWSRDHLPPMGVPAGEFEAWITATDNPEKPGELGPSVCAWRFRRKGATKIEAPEIWPGRPVESDESKAYVAAVAGVVDRVPVGSKVVIYCLVDWIVDAVNERMYVWEQKGELNGKRPFWRIWNHVLKRRREIGADPFDVRASRPDRDGEAIIKELRDWARRMRPDLGSGT